MNHTVDEPCYICKGDPQIKPYCSRCGSDLLDRIRAAQVEAGERVVMDDLKAKGIPVEILMTTPIVACAECGTRNPAHADRCSHCDKPLNGPLLPPRKAASFDTRVKLVQVVIGMAKEAGYDLAGFEAAIRTGWPHV